jgi:hypothetical protein
MHRVLLENGTYLHRLDVITIGKRLDLPEHAGGIEG